MNRRLDPDGIVEAVATVNEIEALPSGLSRKVWQKIMVIETMSLRSRLCYAHRR